MKPIHFAGIALAALAFALGGCSSGGDPSPAPAASAAQWQAVARGKVDVEGGMVQIAARTDGVVETIAVKQGDVVKKDAVLATLDPRAAKIAMATATAGVAEAKAQLAGLQASFAQAAQSAPRIAAAAKAGAATGAAAAQAQASLAQLKAKRAAGQAALAVAQQQLASARLQLDATSLRAPVAGTIVTRHIAVGQTVAAASGQPLFELLPDRPRIVRAQIEADAAAGIRAGMHAQVVRDSGAGPTFDATVLWVGEVLQPAEFTQDPLNRALADNVDCTLALAPPKAGVAPLRIGQRVLVRFPRSSHGKRPESQPR